MATNRGPRIGRADRLAVLHEQREAEAALGLPAGFPAATRLLVHLPPMVTPASAEPLPKWEDVPESAARLAEQLRSLSAASGEIPTRINRHCANTGRDAELARAVEAVRGSMFDLWRAVCGLAEAAIGREGLAKEGERP
jgi:hypothetical protein